jgi:hypothetical protein
MRADFQLDRYRLSGRCNPVTPKISIKVYRMNLGVLVVVNTNKADGYDDSVREFDL